MDSDQRYVEYGSVVQEKCSLNLTAAAIKLIQAGNYTLHVHARNDVSEGELNITISVIGE